MEKGVSYIKRSFDDYKASLREFTETYYPDISKDFDDASVGAWLIDLIASVSDNLSYHTDRVYNETTMDAQQLSSVMALARSNGVKIPGPKGAIAEVEFTCQLPPSPDDIGPDYTYAPYIKRDTQISSSNQVFELMNDVDFNKQFDIAGVSNRIEIPITNSNETIVAYQVSKKVMAIAGESKIQTITVNREDIKPFLSVTIADTNVMGVEGIVVIDGASGDYIPNINEFYNHNEFVHADNSPSQKNTWNFFEVNSLIEQFRWADKSNTDGTPIIYEYSEKIVDDSGKTYYAEVSCVTKGEWKPIKQKFITEFNDKGYLKVTFGQGAYSEEVPAGATDFAKNQISKIINNSSLGILPKSDTKMHILYRRGGGVSSNVAVNTINNIVFLDATFGNNVNSQKLSQVRNTLSVTNTTPSVYGKEMPTIEEIKNFIKYNTMAQERCVTLKDYENRIMMLPSKYGTPFRTGVAEENNKIVIYLLGINSEGKLSDTLPSVVISNLSDYLSEYRMINDFIEIKSGKIINLSFEVDLYIDKAYNVACVITNVSNVIKEYMDINKHKMGEDIYIGDLSKEISKVDGVINMIEIRAYNEFGDEYAKTRSTQSPYIAQDCYNEGGSEESDDTKVRIDLSSAEYILKPDVDSMFEIKYPTLNADIRIFPKTR